MCPLTIDSLDIVFVDRLGPGYSKRGRALVCKPATAIGDSIGNGAGDEFSLPSPWPGPATGLRCAAKLAASQLHCRAAIAFASAPTRRHGRPRGEQVDGYHPMGPVLRPPHLPLFAHADKAGRKRQGDMIALPALPRWVPRHSTLRDKRVALCGRKEGELSGRKRLRVPRRAMARQVAAGLSGYGRHRQVAGGRLDIPLFVG
ncbi:hypothetical protein CDD83_2424 [Cordyceps sp. RAO-2017]|nr:hypothetical protein CDD83_2424 [Cordyceps sp. RAO-2017]